MDPTFAYEMATIFRDGIKKECMKKENIFYYITAMNENYSHPDKPKGCDEDKKFKDVFYNRK